MRASSARVGNIRGERGFTLPELLAAISILGVLVAVVVLVFLALLERWRVDAATDQLVADLRLAHTSATNQLTDWRVVIALDRNEREEGPDYYLVRLDKPYDHEYGARPAAARGLPRFFPGSVKAGNVITGAGALVDRPEQGYWIAPWEGDPSPAPDTRTLEFNSDGTMTFFRSPSGSVCVTVDEDPRNRVIALSATSRVRAEGNSRCNTSSGSG